LKKLRVEGATIQSWSANHNSYGLNNLAFARNGWEDRVDHEALLNDYLAGMFGSAAAEIKPVFVKMIAALKRVETEGPGVSPWLEGYDATKTTGGSFLPDAYTIVYLLEQVDQKFLDGALQRAKGNAANDRERRSVASFAAVAAYWRMAAGALSLDLRARKAEKNGDRSASAALLRQAADGCDGVDEYLKTLPQRGWISVATAPQWPRLAAAFRDRAAKQGVSGA
jgi:hypothetical protein